MTKFLGCRPLGPQRIIRCECSEQVTTIIIMHYVGTLWLYTLCRGLRGFKVTTTTLLFVVQTTTVCDVAARGGPCSLQSEQNKRSRNGRTKQTPPSANTCSSTAYSSSSYTYRLQLLSPSHVPVSSLASTWLTGSTCRSRNVPSPNAPWMAKPFCDKQPAMPQVNF